jgi:hypothetical protein
MLDSLARPVFTFSTRANGSEDRHAARREAKYGLKRPPPAGWNNFRFADARDVRACCWWSLLLLGPA